MVIVHQYPPFPYVRVWSSVTSHVLHATNSTETTCSQGTIQIMNVSNFVESVNSTQHRNTKVYLIVHIIKLTKKNLTQTQIRNPVDKHLQVDKQMSQVDFSSGSQLRIIRQCCDHVKVIIFMVHGLLKESFNTSRIHIQ